MKHLQFTGQQVASALHVRQSLFGARRKSRQVSHLAAWPRLQLAVEMQLHAAHGRRGEPIRLLAVPKITEQVSHCRGSKLRYGPQRQKAGGTQLLLELTGEVRIKREVAGIV